MNWNTVVALVALPCLGGLACAPPFDEVDQAATHELGGVRPEPPKCPDWMCNAATVGDGLVFDELGVDRGLERPTVTPLMLSRVELGGKLVDLEVRGHDVTVNDGGRQVRDADLQGLVLVLEHWINGASYELRFERIVRTEFWAGPLGDVPYHQIRVRKVRQGEQDGRPVGREPDAAFTRSLCAGTPDPEEGQSVSEMAVLFEGDRYDNRRKTVRQVGPGSPWFNIACAGTAMVKMHLLRHSRAGYPPAFAGPATGPSQRQAMLKMLTADYCGDGVPHTVNGHPLLYTDASGLFPRGPLDFEGLLKNGATVEAIWGPNGAVCLDHPRYVERTSIDCASRVPRCGGIANWQQRGHVVSLNPPQKQL